MATAIATLNDQLRGFSTLPKPVQIGVLVGIAATLAVIITVFLWTSRTEYTTLFPRLPERESAAVLESLAQNNIPYRLDSVSGAVQVPTGRVHEARLRLATDGLPRASGFGFELLEQDQGLGTSRSMEDARLQRAIEGELARSIVTLESVESARVHLAQPRQTVFVRDRGRPTASVVVQLHPGRTLDDTRLAGIVHLVSSSVPDLEPEQVTVVDHRGRLLTQKREEGGDLSSTAQQLELANRIEENLSRRVMDLLSPIVGSEGVRAQVTTELDFSRIERTSEAYDPLSAALRSEQLHEEEERGLGTMQGGVPGALVNQPPEGGEIDINGEQLDPQAIPGGPASFSRRNVRNFEIDRTISHIREAPGSIRRLSVAVVVDHQETVNDEGEMVRTPMPDAELDRLAALVRDAVGFNAARGDSVSVITASFRPAPPPEVEPELPIWEQAWAQELIKTILIGLLALVILLTVVRPLIKSLTQRGEQERLAEEEQKRLALLGPDGMPAEGQLQGEILMAEDGSLLDTGIEEETAEEQEAEAALDRQRLYEENLRKVREMVREDPKRVAQLMKTWIMGDGTES